MYVPLLASSLHVCLELSITDCLAQEQSTTNIWHCICDCVRRVVTETAVDPSKIKGIGFDATCSLAVFSTDTDEPVTVTGPNFDNTDGEDRNVILWLDHRPVDETNKINNTKHKLLKYVGGRMSIEMEIPKALWLKNNMPKELFDRCKFYDLTDALTHMATGNETRSFCSTVCKQGYVPVGVDGSEKGWQEDFFEEIGLGDLAKNNFERMGGVHGVVRIIPPPASPNGFNSPDLPHAPPSASPHKLKSKGGQTGKIHTSGWTGMLTLIHRMVPMLALATTLVPWAGRLLCSSVSPKVSP